MSSSANMYDAEKTVDLEKAVDLESSKSYSTTTSQKEGTVDTVDVQSGSVIEKLQSFATRFQLEVHGIERIPEEEKVDDSLWNAAMWFAANTVISTFSIGTLGITIFGMSFWDSLATIIFFSILGMLPVALLYFRPSVWSSPNDFVSFLVCWMGLCQHRRCRSTFAYRQRLPPWVGAIVISVITMIVTLFGYKTVHIYEKWSWIPTFIIFLIVIARFTMSGNFTARTMGSGRIEAGNVLSFGSAIFDYATGWASFASDYVIYQPKSTPKTRIFLGIVGGLGFPLMFCMILGAACMTGTLRLNAANYGDNAVGGLFYSIFIQDSLHGFGQFCLVVLGLSTVANNCPNFCSVALSVQTVSHHLAKVPRFIWTFIATGVVIGIAIPAYYSFGSFMDNFMNLTGYWLAIYEGISLLDHFIFPRGYSGYNVDEYNTPSKLPLGLAALVAFGAGVASTVDGMFQVWFTGPIAKLIPGDVGFELAFAFAFAFVTYVALRSLEQKGFCQNLHLIAGFCKDN
ncbi:permease for cytosine/purines, uracil, thiamine, allantoin-domain-containing protein [Lipomyces arxii]|uniref:permease for cytosine/purines, uracil, thiamine, allantoin-domain-containing protein n=1 Tax=Lipomyces arxii TaxID=56418 RepID=UPI0034CF291C